MTNVFQQIEATKLNELRQLRGDYLRWLASVDLGNPAEKDAGKLADFVAKLGITSQAAERDYAAVTDAKRWREWASGHADADAAYRDADAAFLAACAERQQTFLALNGKVTVLMGERDAAHEAVNRAAQAKADLRRLAESDPLLHSAVVEQATAQTKARKR